MDINLSNKNALVCGSSQGLGLATALELSRLGANVILFARNEERLLKAVKTLDISQGQQHQIIVADFNDPAEVKKVVTDFLQKGNTIQILVNNTGGPKGGNVTDAQPEEFINAFNQHLINNQLLVQEVLPGMKATGYGRIVNIISISVKQPIAGLAVSNTIRGAVASWSKTLANELGPFGITVNNLLPGYTRTARYQSIVDNKLKAGKQTLEEIENEFVSQIPLGRIGKPEEFGAAAAFLCTPAAAYITGINLPVDGGRLQSM